MGAELPTITIVTASFNQGDFFEDAVLSVIGQNYPNLEYAIVDGGSDDVSRDVIERYRDRCAFVICEPDHGQSHAINKGLARSRGEVIGWLNADDLLLPGALGLVGEFFAHHPEKDWLIGRCRNIDARGATVAGDASQAPTGDFTLAGALLRDQPFNIPQPATFFRRSLLDSVGLLDERLHHCMDFDLWCRFLRLGVQPTCIATELACYRFHDTSKTCAQPNRFLRALLEIEGRYAPLLSWPQRVRLWQKMGYQRRALALRTSANRGDVWRQVFRRPWWILSQQVRSGLRAARPAA